MTFHDVKEGGYLVDVCWTSGEGDLFIATRLGKGIRFRESQVHSKGTLGLRVDMDDAVVAITAVTESSGVFMLTNDGKGTIRLMSGFRANASPGSGGKVAMKTDDLIAAFAVTDTDEIFAISQTSKMIRFTAEEVPPKEGVVQGVNCMALRNDVVTAVAVSTSSVNSEP
jgi:DNA gyrase subunit A